MEHQSPDDSTSVCNMVTEYLHLTVEIFSLSRKMAFKVSMPIGNVSAHLIVVREKYDETSTVFMPANTACVWQPVGQEGIFDFQSIFFKDYIPTSLQ